MITIDFSMISSTRILVMISSAPPFGYLGRLEVRVFLRSAVEDSFYSVSVPYSGSIHLILQGTGGEATILQGVNNLLPVALPVYDDRLQPSHYRFAAQVDPGDKR